VLGEAYVNNALKNVDEFNKPFQDLLNEYCWGSVWGREELPRNLTGKVLKKELRKQYWEGRERRLV